MGLCYDVLVGPMQPDRIPLFPLNLVLFPGEPLPLHIFEPRYRRMVRECLDAKTQFGMLLALSDGVARVGCSAEILEVTKRYDDGRMDILTVGRHRFRIVDLFTEDPLLQGNVDYLLDEDSALDPRKQKELIDLYEVCYTLLFSGMPRNIDDCRPDQISFAVSGVLPIDLLWKQQILELHSEAERQDRLIGYLREWAPHLQKVETLRTRTAGNGHGLN
jgi:Lon protease-like protein